MKIHHIVPKILQTLQGFPRTFEGFDPWTARISYSTRTTQRTQSRSSIAPGYRL